MISANRAFAFLFCLLVSVQVFAQKEKKYTSTDPRAIRAFETAAGYYDARQDEQALRFLQHALDADPAFVEAYMMRANIFTDQHLFPQAIAAYKKAIEINPDFFPNNFYSLAKAEFTEGAYADARGHLERFLAYPKINPGLAQKGKQLMASCAFAEQAIKSPIPFKPVNMGPAINTPEEEYFPAITADGATFLFTRRSRFRDGSGRANKQEDFYVSHKGKDGAWSDASPVTEINTGGNEGAPALSADGQYLFFTACEELLSNDARKTKGSCDLFLTKKIGDKFGPVRNLEMPVNTGAWESQPSFSSDGRTLYFVRAITGSDGKRQRDILMTRIGDNSSWTDPVSVSDKINTSGDEMSVFIHPDDQTLYFTSDGHPGMGGLDIFLSRRQPDGTWGEPVNLGYPINTGADENSLLVSPDGKLGFFASDRTGGYGQLDLYQFELPQSMRPIAVTYMKGKVYDADTKKPLAAGFELIDLSTRKTVVSSTSNVGSGEYLVCLPAGKSYALNVAKDGYLFFSESFRLDDPKAASDPVIKDIPLKPIRVGESVVLKNIFFEFDKFDLKDESRAELSRVIDFLLKNGKVNVEIGGHTDNVGSKTYNLNLSDKRARAVYDYLVAQGIPAARLSSRGYGDTKPVADNSTEQGRAQNRRTEFTIVSVAQ
jgi:outer membrane protein OmpA-like peptidoglycan-associated protein/Tol biopolymer transport system component